MKLRRVFIAANWADITVNIQTKEVAKKLSETSDVVYFSQGRINGSMLRVNDRLTVLQWPNKRPNKLKDLIFLGKKILAHRPDILIVHYDATILCLIVSWLLRVKYRIGWIHTVTNKYALDATDKKDVSEIFSRRKKIYKLATHVVVMTDYSAKDAMMYYGIPEKKIIKIANGVDAAPSIANSNGKISIRYVGRVDFSKGVDILVDAFKKLVLENNKAVLEIIGRGDELERLKAIVDKENLNDRIFFHGYWGNYEKARKFIAEAYCLVVPSRADNFPTVVLEAFSCGVPVIASNAGGIPEMIVHETEGYLVNNGDVEAFTESMKKMIDNPELRTRMSAQARKTFQEKFSMEKHVGKVVEFLEGLK